MKGAATTQRKAQRGVVAVEFALLLVPLLVILAGITEFGRAMYYYNTILKATRDGARLMSTQTPTDSDYVNLKVKAACTILYGNTDCTGNVLLPGLPEMTPPSIPPMISISDPFSVTEGSTIVNGVTVTVGNASAPFTFQSLALFGVKSFTFAPISVTMRQGS